MLKPVLQAQNSGGVVVSIGELSNTKYLYPVLPFIIGDNEELSRLCGIKTGSSTYKQCRCCLCPNDLMHEFRNHKSYEWRNRSKVIDDLSKVDTLLRDKNKYLVEYSMYDVQDHNFLFQNSDKLFGLPERPTAFYEAFPPDNLHTLLAGVMRYTVCWTLEIIKIVSGKKGLTLLDKALLMCNVGAATDSEFEFKVPSMV